jgi:hypothetical protein
VYRLSLIVLVLGALVSLAVAIAFIPISHRAAEYRTPEEYFRVLQRVEEEIKRERDVCKKIDGLIIGLSAREAFLKASIDEGSVEDDQVRLDQVRALKEKALEARRMLATECDENVHAA